jgi:monomeric sarcosine oxidase
MQPPYSPQTAPSPGLPAYDVVVVGAGAVGAAAAYALARRGARVLLLEQEQVGHARGSSHGGSRIFRYTHPSIAEAAIMPAMAALWRELEAEAGESLLEMCGGLFIARPDDLFLVNAMAALEALEIPFERLDATDMARRYPQFRLRDDEIALFQPRSGILAASRAVAAMVRAAQRAGATLCTDVRVHAIAPNQGGVTLTVSDKGHTQQISVGRVVIAAGPWAKQLLAPLLPNPLTLNVTHQQVAYYRANQLQQWSTQRAPIYIFSEEPHLYGFPIFERPGYIKVALELLDTVVDPDQPRTVRTAEIEALSATVATRLAGIDPEPANVELCLYTETPERAFLIDRHPEHPQIVFAAGMSGRGFKFAIGLGELLAHLATTPSGAYEHPFWLPQFSLNNHARGATAAQPAVAIPRDL